MKKILFMCVANSARSQMAEGIARALFPNIEFQSAGSMPSRVNPLAIEVMKEINIDISNHSSKDFESLNDDFINNLDYVIPLCKEEVCPLLNSDAIVIPIPLEDPASENFSDHQLNKFREVRDLIKYKLKELIINFGD
ncbi:arsenate reductase ArsC [Pelagibacterales bacterium SAG-MED31]|jgi:arsenate reductase|nr:arsenate reductase ArsC [Pelagibacterales bacterium SAG-MED31]|tara:strand:- start:2950 stop:3363 length:414 start_codon:yes stop_codon:yes gene_type:complete